MDLGRPSKRPRAAHHCGLALVGLAIALEIEGRRNFAGARHGLDVALGWTGVDVSGANSAGAANLRNVFDDPRHRRLHPDFGWLASTSCPCVSDRLSLFAVPMPDWLIDAATVPLKVFISNMVTNILYAAGYPVAQNGVMIMIGTYQLLVKDACSGMNSIFALSAIGVFYAYAFRWSEKVRSIILLMSIIPITIWANFIRVIALVLIAYYGGPDMLEGIVHDLTGISLFVVALFLLFLLDAALGLCIAAYRGLHVRPRQQQVAV